MRLDPPGRLRLRRILLPRLQAALVLQVAAGAPHAHEKELPRVMLIPGYTGPQQECFVAAGNLATADHVIMVTSQLRNFTDIFLEGIRVRCCGMLEFCKCTALYVPKGRTRRMRSRTPWHGKISSP